jgi:hypothetical protein
LGSSHQLSKVDEENEDDLQHDNDLSNSAFKASFKASITTREDLTMACPHRDPCRPFPLQLLTSGVATRR